MNVAQLHPAVRCTSTCNEPVQCAHRSTNSLYRSMIARIHVGIGLTSCASDGQMGLWGNSSHFTHACIHLTSMSGNGYREQLRLSVSLRCITCAHRIDRLRVMDDVRLCESWGKCTCSTPGYECTWCHMRPQKSNPHQLRCGLQ